MITIIFANGVLDHAPALSPLLKQAELIIAVDGGANHCAGLGIIPDILLGDLDSIEPAILTGYKSDGVTIHRHPKRKNATDLELALDLAMEKGAQTIWLAAALGGRWDMSLANILLGAADKYKGQKIFLLGQDFSMQILHPDTRYTISGRPGQRISFLPLKGAVHGVTLTGCEYPLTGHTIAFGSSLGVSNILKTSQATVQHTIGVLLCILFN